MMAYRNFLIVILLLCCLSSFAFLPSYRSIASVVKLGWPLAVNIMGSVEAINAELIAKREHEELVGSRYPTKVMQPLPLASLRKRLKNGDSLVNTLLLRDGCVSIKQVLSQDVAEALCAYVNREMVISEEAVTNGKDLYDRRFGAVNNRRRRADMFLPSSEYIVMTALQEATKNLTPMLDELDGMLSTGVLHEVNNIILNLIFGLNSILTISLSLSCSLAVSSPILDLRLSAFTAIRLGSLL